MTNKEATELLDKITSYCDFTDEYGDMIDSTPYYKAIDFAIKLLEQQPCEDCISRAEVLKILEKEEFKGDAIYEIEKKLPSVTPKEKTGEWIFTTEGNIDHITCSICGRDSMSNFDYCPNCGCYNGR